MNYMNILYSYLIFFAFYGLGNSQCDSIVLRNQLEINQFISTYGKCTEVNHLIIKDVDADITQLDSLYSLERINGDLRLNFRSSNENFKNINGLKNLKYVNYLNGNSYKVTGQFSNLDTLYFLAFNDILSEFTHDVFSFFPNIKHIEEHLSISNTLVEENTQMFTTGSNFELTIGYKMDSTSLKVLSQRIKREHLKSLMIFPADGIDLRHLTIIDSVEHLHFAYNKNCNFTNIATIKNLKSLTLQNDLGNNDFGEGLKYIEDIDYLFSQNNKFKIDYEKILPILKSIKDQVLISSHDSLYNLGFLENVSPPQDSNEYTTVNISNNRRLNDCNSSFLCEALKRYPNSVNIQNNASKCTKDEILKYCKMVDTDEEVDLPITLSPNPAYQEIQLLHAEGSFDYEIKSINGQHLLSGIVHDHINVMDLPPGIYILSLKSQNSDGIAINKRFVKM